MIYDSIVRVLNKLYKIVKSKLDFKNRVFMKKILTSKLFIYLCNILLGI